MSFQNSKLSFVVVGFIIALHFGYFPVLHYNKNYLKQGDFMKLSSKCKGNTFVLWYHQMFIPQFQFCLGLVPNFINILCCKRVGRQSIRHPLNSDLELSLHLPPHSLFDRMTAFPCIRRIKSRVNECLRNIVLHLFKAHI